jgi:hypothetical protein
MPGAADCARFARVERHYAVIGREPGARTERALGELAASLEAAGWVRSASEEAALVLHVIDPEAPVPYRRRSRATYVAAVCESAEEPTLRGTYPLLVRSLSNIVLSCGPGGVWFTTMERGFYRVSDDVAAHLLPLAGARLVIDNEFRTDLEPELWAGDERDLRHVKLLYGIGGLSYGNLSARRDERRFWMSASGVDKARLEQPGRDILLVSDYDDERGTIVLSVPPGVEPKRVSVDAIEHWMIYREHPDVGAILHVHGWIDGIPSTELNFPCGSEELALAVSAALAREPDPVHAVIGLHNHGITATGESLPEILGRIGDLIRPQVPMT